MSKISWEPLTPLFGARVDLDVREELSPDVAQALQELFDQKLMLLFNSPGLTYEDQRRTVSIFGSVIDENGLKYLSKSMGYKGEPTPEPAMLDPSSSTTFHNDYAFTPNYLEGISLFAEEIDPGVEGTRFLSLRNGYLELSDDDRAVLEGRTVLQAHDVTILAGNTLRFKDFTPSETIMAAEHPLLYPMPRTGQKVLLYIPWFTSRIVGMPDDESAEWFAKFEALLYQEEKIYTHHWEKDDFVVWSNVGMQHGREFPDELPDPHLKRTLRRVTFGTQAANEGAVSFHERRAVEAQSV